MDRRSFIKLTAVSGTTAAVAACSGGAENTLVRFVPAEDIIPGQATWKPSVCPMCASGCGLTVRVMDADHDVVRDGQAGVVRIYAAKKLEGAAEHPVNHGGLCTRGQAAIQATYHPDRITQPLKRSGNRGEAKYQAVSWDEALTELIGRLDMLASSGNQRALTFLGRRRAGHRGLVVEQFLAKFGAPPPITWELFDDDVLRRANGLSFGRAQMPTFDLANARFVISFGADFLGTWNSPVSQSHAYGEMRQGRRGVRGAFVQVEARMSQTGANADQWVPVRPGTDAVLALGLAHALMAAKAAAPGDAGRAGTLIDGWGAGLPDYTPEAVEKQTGVTAARITRLAAEMADMRPAVAMIGGPALAHTNGLFAALAVNALNALLGAVEQPGGVSFTPQWNVAAAAKAAAPAAKAAAPAAQAPAATGASAGSLQQMASAVLAGDAAAPQVLMLDGANPVFDAPTAWRVREALEKVPYIVSVGSFLDETSSFADLILPDHSFLESWVESVPESGSLVAVASAAPPTMVPLHQTRATADVLLDVSRRLATPLDLPWESMEALLGATFAAFPPAAEGGDPWQEAQEKGGWWGTLAATQVASVPGIEPGAPAAPTTFAEPQFDGDASKLPFHFLPYASTTFYDGSAAHLPWLQEMPDPLTSAMWSSWVEINPQTAAKLGIGEGDLVDLTSAHGTLRSSAVITPGIAPDVVGMPMGQGHTQFTRYATGRGENPAALLAPLTVDATGSVAWAATRVSLARAGDPDGRLVLFAGGKFEEGHEGEEHR
jgi:anaerobic selenocysteine-containing dehydrogenase